MLNEETDIYVLSLIV